MQNIVAALLAAGHGTLDGKGSKLLEPVDLDGDVPMVRLPLGRVKSDLQIHPTYVVVNGRFGPTIRQTLIDHDETLFVHQPVRSGTAGAVKLVLDTMEGQNGYAAEHMLVLYGDMPLLI